MRGRLYRKLRKRGIASRATWRRFEKEARRREGRSWLPVVAEVALRSAVRAFRGLAKASKRFA